MYTIRQAWCGSHVFHRCFDVDQSNSKLLYVQKSQSRDLLLVYWELWGFSSDSSDTEAFSHLPRGSICNKQPLIHSSNIKAPRWYTPRVNSKRSKAGPRQGVIFYTNLLCFNQPTKTERHLISMLMRLASSLLVRCCLYAVWLERNNNAVPIRARCNSPLPT